jgi:hypothetical protein
MRLEGYWCRRKTKFWVEGLTLGVACVTASNLYFMGVEEDMGR